MEATSWSNAAKAWMTIAGMAAAGTALWTVSRWTTTGRVGLQLGALALLCCCCSAFSAYRWRSLEELIAWSQDTADDGRQEELAELRAEVAALRAQAGGFAGLPPPEAQAQLPPGLPPLWGPGSPTGEAAREPWATQQGGGTAQEVNAELGAVRAFAAGAAPGMPMPRRPETRCRRQNTRRPLRLREVSWRSQLPHQAWRCCAESCAD